MHEMLKDVLRESGWRDDESMPIYDGDETWTPPDSIDDTGCILLILSTQDHTTDHGKFVPAGRITLQVEQPEESYPDNIVFSTWDIEEAAAAALMGMNLL